MSAVGIDYSMTCPAACAFSEFSIDFWFAHACKADVNLPYVTADIVPESDSVTARARYLADRYIAWHVSKHPDVLEVHIEDYAFNATGRVFHIGENTGILKYVLDGHNLAYVPIAPTVIKKFATGKGNADKSKVTAAFLEAYPGARAWIPLLFPRTKGVPAKSPLADLADAYWLARYSFEKNL